MASKKSNVSAPAAVAAAESGVGLDKEKHGGPYWVKLRYGEGEEMLINSDCAAAVLIGHVRRACGHDKLADDLELLKEPERSVVGLADKGSESAALHLAAGATYTLARLDGAERTPVALYTEPAADES